MDDFVTARLIKNEVGAEHEGIIYDRWLTFQHESGHEVRVFDKEVLSTDLQMGEVYKVMLEPFLPRIRITEAPVDDVPATWSGIILALDWQPPTTGYLCASRYLYRGQYVLVQSSIGCLLIEQSDLKETVDLGTLIQWDKTRLDLLAVFEPK